MLNFLKKKLVDVSPSIISVALGLLLGLIVMLLFNASNAFPAFGSVIKGRGFGFTLAFSTVLIALGLSIGFAFKTGLFNIGLVGQFSLGGYAALYSAIKLDSSWIVSMLIAMVVAGLWALIPGLLKAFFNVNEVVAGIMLNYTALFTVNILVRKNILDPVLKSKSLTAPRINQIPTFGLEKLFKSPRLNGGIIVVIVAAILVYVVLEKTTFGYELKTVGKNRHAAKYAGINEKRSVILSMVISGALAGLAATVYYLDQNGHAIDLSVTLNGTAFDGISVALLALNNPLGIILSALFLGHIQSTALQLVNYGFNEEVVNIIISSIIYASAFALLLRKVVAKYVKVDETVKVKKEEK